MPEGNIPLTHAIIYVCEAEKSNSVVLALNKAKKDAENNPDDNVPEHLKNQHYDEKNPPKYKYPHDFAGGYVEQQYLPDSLKDKIYYSPSDYGFEKTVKQIRKDKGKLK